MVVFPEALPVVLGSTTWEQRSSVQEVYRLLRIWSPPEPTLALQLLDAQYDDPKVRAYAVCCLERMSDQMLRLYLLQLIQVLKYVAGKGG